MPSPEYRFNQPEADPEPNRAPGASAEASGEPGRRLPLEATAEPWPGAWATGWAARLPLRAERITLGKQAVVAEQVTVRRRRWEEVVPLSDQVRREQARIVIEGALEVTRTVEPIPVGAATPGAESIRTKSG